MQTELELCINLDLSLQSTFKSAAPKREKKLKMTMQISDRSIAVASSTLKTLILELGAECQNVTALVNQLQIPHLSATQQAEILEAIALSTTYQSALQNQSDRLLICKSKGDRVAEPIVLFVLY